MKTVHLICAARPNFMKIAPLYHALKKTDWCQPRIVHVQQHRSGNMAGDIMTQLGLKPDKVVKVKCGETSPRLAQEIALGYEALLRAGRPNAVIVPGDVTASLACARATARLHIRVVHLEAGLRLPLTAPDREMPEEDNRIAIDRIGSLFLTPSEDADANLIREKLKGKIERVGNIMLDAFEMLRPLIDAVPLAKRPYVAATFHRPINVDDNSKLLRLFYEVVQLAKEVPVIFPVHPRTRRRLDKLGVSMTHKNLYLFEPMPYVEFMSLVKNATIVITDSGGVQEETSYLGVPCATVRENTERPVTISHGTNELITPAQIVPSALRALRGEWKKGGPIPMWDGHAAGRCVDALHTFLTSQSAKTVNQGEI